MDLLKEYEQKTNEELLELLNSYIVEYSPPSYIKMEYTVLFKNGLEFFNIFDTISEEDFEKKIHAKLLNVTTLHHVFVSKGLIDEEDDQDMSQEYLVKFNRIFEILYYWQNLISCMLKLKKRTNPNYDGEINTCIGYSRFQPLELDSLTPYQQLLEFLLFRLRERGYRRQENRCMKRIYTNDNFDTHAWKEIMTIEQFVYNETDRNSNREQFYNRTKNPGNTKSAIIELEKTMDKIHFPEVVKDRYLFSFRNGIYEILTNPDDNEETYQDRWYPYKECESSKFTSKNVHTHRSACNFINSDFEYKEYYKHDWYKIPTPNFQKILDYQDFPEEVCKWMYIMLGRLLYQVGHLDDWQKMPFLKGKAKTGKSTIITKVCKLFYDNIDVGVLGNNCEPRYALSGLSNKLIFIGPEIKGNLKLEQAEFQNIVSGEDTNINEKYKTPTSCKWSVPGIIAGNQPPNYQDNQGSVSRRLVIFEFINKVKNGDTRLGKKLQKEIPNLLLKCNRAYLDTIDKHRDTDIEKLLPKYFIETRNIMAEETNALYNFLNSDVVIYDPDYRITKDRLFQAFKLYCDMNRMKAPQLIKQYYEGPFEDMNITSKRKKLIDTYDQVSKHTTWCFGIDLRADIERNHSNHSSNQEIVDILEQ